MSQITLHLGNAQTGDSFTVVCRWTDDNLNVYSEEIVIENDDDDLIISHDDNVLLRLIGTGDNRER